jgi:Ca2+:H+ antiporter
MRLAEYLGPGGISAIFVGPMLTSVIGNAAEHATPVTVAAKDRIDLAIGVALATWIDPLCRLL